MKSTYHLLGVHWDGLDEAPSPDFIPYDPTILDSHVEACLFDHCKKKRKVPLSDLLKLNSLIELRELLFPLRDCDVVAVEMDYIPVFAGTIALHLYKRRVRQIMSAVAKQTRVPVVVLMNSYSENKDLHDQKPI